MRLSLKKSNRLSELKAQIVELSKARSIDDVKAWWKALSSHDKALIIAGLQSGIMLGVLWKAHWAVKVIMVIISGATSYVVTKVGYDLIDSIEEQELSAEEFRNLVLASAYPEHKPDGEHDMIVNDGMNILDIAHRLNQKATEVQRMYHAGYNVLVTTAEPLGSTDITRIFELYGFKVKVVQAQHQEN